MRAEQNISSALARAMRERTKPVSIGVLAVLAETSRRNDSRFFFLSIFGSSPPAKRFENHFASAAVKHVLYPEQQGWSRRGVACAIKEMTIGLRLPS
jgi:hypothetical protein